jgi:hypothetical protein
MEQVELWPIPPVLHLAFLPSPPHGKSLCPGFLREGPLNCVGELMLSARPRKELKLYFQAILTKFQNLSV